MIYFDEKKEAFAFKPDDFITAITDSLWSELSADENSWDIIDGKFIDLRNTEEYKQIQERKEKERIARLSMTKLDFAKYIQNYGIAYSQLKNILNSDENVQMQWDLCERVYRFNPLLDELAKDFGITPEQLDTMFKLANGEN